MGRLFGTNGVRGVFGELISPPFVYHLAESIGKYFSGKEILVGCDTRYTKEVLLRAVFAGLSAAGSKFYYSGIAPTPAHQYAVKHYGLDGGIVVTASHNPPEYNGIKVLGENGDELPHKEEDKIEEIFFEEKSSNAGNPTKCLGELDSINPYVTAIKEKVDFELISKNRFKIIVDPACGAASLCVAKLAKALGVKAFLINSQPDGYFPSREPEPLMENLKELSEFSRSLNPDLAIAFDGDADRAIFLDEKGRIIWGDRSGAILSRYVIRKHGKGYLVVGVSASSLVEKVVKEEGGEVVWTKVGSVIITEKINELLKKGVFAFGLEENGGFFYTPHQPTRDGCMSLALMLECLAKTGKKLSVLNDELPKLWMLKTKIEAKGVDRNLVIEKLAEIFSGYKQDKIDGVRVWLNENEWFLARPSGTEPLIRIFAESYSQESAMVILEKVKNILRGLLEK